MKKYFFIALLCAAQWCWAATVTAPENIPAYYASLNGKAGKSLYTTLNTVTNVGFKSLGYDGAITAYQKSDVYPSDPNHPDYVAGKAGKLWDMYGGCSFTAGDECGGYKGECDCYNREHSIPKSWWGGGKNNMYSDIFHLVPTDGYVNNRRSSYAFGEVNNVTYTYNGCKLGSPKAVSTDKNTIYNATSATCSASPVFEPRDEYKGDFARGYLGMIAKYSNTSYSITSGAGSTIFEAFSSTSHFGLTQYGVVLLMKWHREDPVSQKEIDRNNGIQQTQGNRNPFIDYPYLAEYIWGERAGQQLDLALLMPSTDKDFIPGKSNGLRDGAVPVDPETPVVKYGVTWSVNGEETRTDSVAENAKPYALPAEPTSCSTESTEFVGWTDAPIDGEQDQAPETLYTAAKDFPALTGDVTYYAVFAKKTISENAAPAIYTYSTDSKEGWTNTAFKSNSYWILRTGLYLESPMISLAGLDSVKMRLRTYGGSTYNTVTVTANGAQIATLKASNNSMAEQKWTNTGSLTGTSTLRFESSTSTTSYGPAFDVVTIYATGAGATYSRFITSCQTATELEMVPEQKALPARKVLIGGHIFILVGDRLFTPAGQRVR